LPAVFGGCLRNWISNGTRIAYRLVAISHLRLEHILMNNWDDFDRSIRETDITNPAFVDHVRSVFPDKRVRPDDQDFDLSADISTEERAKQAYRRAQAQKLIRMFREWKVTQN
jgi:hypothetical protein